MKLYETLVGTDADQTTSVTGTSAILEIPFDQFIVSCFWAGELNFSDAQRTLMLKG